MGTYKARVHLTWDWEDQERYSTDSMEFQVEAESGPAALELVFAITNSYPEESFAPAIYLPAVEAWRQAGHRSLSVGDVVELDDGQSAVIPAYRCASVGWEEVKP